MSELLFDPAAHRYTLDGVELPSVTQVLKINGLVPEYPGGDFYKKRGTAAHAACASLARGTLSLEPDGSVSLKTDSRIRGFVESFRRWLRLSGFQIKLIETTIHSPTWLVAGTVDYYGTIDGKGIVVDLKTGKPARPAADLQTAAYALMLKEIHNLPVHDRITLCLDPDGGTPEEQSYENMAEDMRHFLSALSIMHLRKRFRLL